MEAHLLDWLPDDETPLLEAALEYRARGFRPIPIFPPTPKGCACRLRAACAAAGKHPIVRGWQRSCANERTIRARWTAWPHANVGLVTGGPARLVVLDVDGTAGQDSLRDLAGIHGALPETLTSLTGGGGEQRLFRLAPELDLLAIGNSVRKLGAGLDVRASGGQIVVAPSLHRSGRRYRWLNREAIALLPRWLSDLLAATTRAPRPLPPWRPHPDRLRRYGQVALERGASLVAAAKAGTRNATLFREAASLAELVAGGALGEDSVRRALVIAARNAGLHAFEIRMTLKSAFRRGLQRPRLPP